MHSLIRHQGFSHLHTVIRPLLLHELPVEPVFLPPGDSDKDNNNDDDSDSDNDDDDDADADDTPHLVTRATLPGMSGILGSSVQGG